MFRDVTVTSCGWLNIPDVVKMQPVKYTVGSQVTIFGCMSGFYSDGSTKVYMCESTGYQTAAWTPTIGYNCICQYLVNYDST